VAALQISEPMWLRLGRGSTPVARVAGPVSIDSRRYVREKLFSPSRTRVTTDTIMWPAAFERGALASWSQNREGASRRNPCLHPMPRCRRHLARSGHRLATDSAIAWGRKLPVTGSVAKTPQKRSGGACWPRS